jgi:hypothetical protein
VDQHPHEVGEYNANLHIAQDQLHAGRSKTVKKQGIKDVDKGK